MRLGELSNFFSKLYIEDSLKPDADGQYVFHNLFGQEYRGATPEAVIQAMYEFTKSGMDVDYSGWWDYQARAVKTMGGGSVPDRNAPDACEKLLAIFVRLGCLEPGSLPVKPAPQAGKRGPDV